MADEPRRSGRERKPKQIEDPEPTAPKSRSNKKGGKKNKEEASTEPEPEGDEGGDDAPIRCVCGEEREDDGLDFVACENCDAWQHTICMGLPSTTDPSFPPTYLCEQCDPSAHKELLAAMKKGQKPWEARLKQWEQEQQEEEARKKSKKGKKGRASKGGRQSQGPVAAVEEPKQPSPAVVIPQDPIQEPQADGISEVNGDAKANGKSSSPAVDRVAAGEKRRRSTHPDGDTSVKRRKSSMQTPQSASTGVQDLAELPTDRKRAGEALAKQFATFIREASKSGQYRIPDGDTADSVSKLLALQIEDALVQTHGAPGDSMSGYLVQFRAILANTKKNPVLLESLLNGRLSSGELATMSSEDMADEETRRRDAQLREENDKQAMLLKEDGPRIRRTHKGEELIEDYQSAGFEAASSHPVTHRPAQTQAEEQAEPVDSAMEDSQQVELPEDIGRAPLAIDTTATPTADDRRQSSATFNIDNVWNKVQHSPDAEAQQRLLSQPPRRRSSAMHQPQQAQKDDADIDRLLKDEPDSPQINPQDYTQQDPSISWQGSLSMQNVGRFPAIARFVAGGDLSQYFPWPSLIPSSAEITGRLDKDKANEYISNMRSSNTTGVAVLALSPITVQHTPELEKIFNYFHTRARWGVIATNTPTSHKNVRDMYIVPVPAGAGPLPPFLDMLEHCEIETPRPSNMLLITMAVRVKSPPPSQQGTPMQGDGNQAPPVTAQTPTQPQGQFPPALPYGGSYGSPYAQQQPPSGHYAPTQPQQALPGAPDPSSLPPIPPHHSSNPEVHAILGPFLDTPVVRHILGSGAPVGKESMENLRDVLMKHPEARSDMAEFGRLLKMRQR